MSQKKKELWRTKTHSISKLSGVSFGRREKLNGLWKLKTIFCETFSSTGEVYPKAAVGVLLSLLKSSQNKQQRNICNNGWRSPGVGWRAGDERITLFTSWSPLAVSLKTKPFRQDFRSNEATLLACNFQDVHISIAISFEFFKGILYKFYRTYKKYVSRSISIM